MTEPIWEKGYTQNRELSWLQFNARVLEEAEDETVPLLERVKFLSIFTSNLDEFYMIRVGSLGDVAALGGHGVDNKSGLTAKEQLERIYAATAPLYERRDRVFRRVERELGAEGLQRLRMSELTQDEHHYIRQLFRTAIQPLLSPQIVDAHHPFPHLASKTLHVGVRLSRKKSEFWGLIPMPPSVPELLFLPEQNGICRYVPLEEVLLFYADSVFEMYSTLEKVVFCVTRNADINPDDEPFAPDGREIDLRAKMEKLLRERRRLCVVRVELSAPISGHFAELFRKRFDISGEQIFVSCEAPLCMDYAFSLGEHLPEARRAALSDPPFTPQQPAMLLPGQSLLRAALKRDLFLSYPYESMEPFLQMVREAANAPDVLSIRITIYRLARKAKLVDYLCAAAENGKDVTVLIELRARFDEQNNIDWSKHLEEAGCTVIYGFDDYKVHSKLTLITKKSAHGYSYITQIGTGNYNEKTSELYTDYSFITADLGIGEEASNVFQNLAVQKLTEESEKMLVAPLRFKSVLLDEMDRVINAARLGRPASMILKNNSISDRDIILKLEEASCAGVRIDMIVRGICCVRAGVPGKTENLHIRSLVGRYLEHGRIYSFFDGVNTRTYIASGDFLTRNTECRVEVGVRVEDPVLKEKLDSILRLQLSDNVNAREMQPDGSYQKVKPAPGEPLVNSQMGMYDLLRDDWTARDKAAAPVEPPKPIKAPEMPAAPAKAVPQPAAPAPAEKPQAKAAPAPMPVVVTESRSRSTGLLGRLLGYFRK